jgi:hypothetical protein
MKVHCLEHGDQEFIIKDEYGYCKKCLEEENNEKKKTNKSKR